MINKEKTFVLANIDNEITGELNERFNDCVINGSCDYDKGIIKLEIAEPFEGEALEEVEDIIVNALPYEYETEYNIDGYYITITVGEELDEWEQDMKYSNCESYEEQYYSTETIHIASLFGAIQSLEALYTTQPFAKDSQKYECLVSHFIEQKMERLKELKEVFEKYRTIIEEEEKAQNDLKEMKNMLNLF
jgi:hypothetical protein